MKNVYATLPRTPRIAKTPFAGGGSMVLRHYRRNFSTLLSLLTLLSLTPLSLSQEREKSAAQPEVAVVITNVENMYLRPDEGSPIASQTVLGTTVKIIEARDEWYRIETPDTYQGWVRRAAVRKYSPSERTPYAAEGRVAEVINLFANIYRQPSVTTMRPIQVVTIGVRLPVVGEKQNWFEISLPTGERGWIQRGDVVEVDPKQPRRRGTVEDLLKLSKRFLGLPYLWGGTSPFGMDCSGYVQLVFSLNGIQLLRDAHLQYADPNLTAVRKEEIQPGDLLFFGPSEERITHVGLHLGNKEFINATTHDSPIVQISRLDDPYWAKLWVGARRAKGLAP